MATITLRSVKGLPLTNAEVDGNFSALNTDKSEVGHTHPLSDVTDSGTAAGLNVPATGDAAATEVVKGDDTRLSDARAPTAHTHTVANITDAGTAALAEVGDFASAAQGTKADTATQPGDLATVATSGAYTHLSDKPSIPVSGTDFVAKSGGTFTGNVTFDETTETVYNLTGTSIDPGNGTIQYKTLTANTTFTEALADGQSVLLRLATGDSYTVTWPTITWVGGSAPTLTADDVLVFWQEGTTVYGNYLGSVA